MKPTTSLATVALLMLCTAGAQAQQQRPTPVRVDAVRMEPVQQLRQVTGNVRAVTRSRVAAIEPGRVVDLLTLEGQTVTAGEVLATIDAARLKIQLRQLQADIAVQEAVLAEREAQVELRESDLVLIESMQQRGAVNPKELSDARLELSVAQARREQARRELQVKQAEAQLIEQRIDDTIITAPFDGVVISRLTERGEWVAEGNPIVELVSTGTFDVWLDVPQRLARAVHRGVLSIMVHVDALEQTFESHAARIVGDIDAASRTFALVVRIDEAQRDTDEGDKFDVADTPRLAPGMSVTAWIPTGDRAEQLTVHKDAVLRNDAGAFVFVVQNSDGGASLASVPVDVLFALEERFVVRGTGLSAGSQTVIEGGERLRPGAAVAVVGSGESTAGLSP